MTNYTQPTDFTKRILGGFKRSKKAQEIQGVCSTTGIQNGAEEGSSWLAPCWSTA